MAASRGSDERAIRARARGVVQGSGLRAATVARAAELGVRGWVRNDGDDLLVHAEGDRVAVERLVSFLEQAPPGAAVEALGVEEMKPEGHEQFAIRGISAGAFVVEERRGRGRRFVLGLEVDGAMRSWTLPRGPSMDPAVRRMAIEDDAIELDHAEASNEGGSIAIWDRGGYEQGGRVAWPEALDRGHAVFILHGERLRGGFALQRTRSGTRPQWLLIKRRDDEARPGADVVSEP